MTGKDDDGVDLTVGQIDSGIETLARPDFVLRPSLLVKDRSLVRENARGTITTVLIVVFALILIYPLVAITFDWATIEDLEKLLSILLPGITGILGAVIGFYFGSSE